MLLIPSARCETKLRHSPAEGHLLKAGFLRLGQIGLGLAAYDNITAAGTVQIADQLSRKKSGIGQKTNSRASHVSGNLLQTCFDELTGTSIGSCVARPQ